MTSKIRLVLTGLAAVVLLGATVAVWAIDDDPDPAPLAQRGHTLFATKGCVGCHAAPDHEPTAGQAPDLTRLHEVAATRRDGMTAEEYVRESILAPQAFLVSDYGWLEMPLIPLTTDEVDAIIAYLLQPDDGDS